MMLMGESNPPALQPISTGCDECDLTGFKGRIGIYEMLVLNEAMRGAVRDGGRNDEIRALARRNGMKLMHEYALERVKEGLTTLDEIQRVVPFEQRTAVNCKACHQELAGPHAFCPHCGERASPGGISEAPDKKLQEQEMVHR